MRFLKVISLPVSNPVQIEISSTGGSLAALNLGSTETKHRGFMHTFESEHL